MFQYSGSELEILPHHLLAEKRHRFFVELYLLLFYLLRLFVDMRMFFLFLLNLLAPHDVLVLLRNFR